MGLVSLSRFGLSRIGLRAGLCAASAVIQRKSYALDAVPGRSSPGHRCPAESWRPDLPKIRNGHPKPLARYGPTRGRDASEKLENVLFLFANLPACYDDGSGSVWRTKRMTVSRSPRTTTATRPHSESPAKPLTGLELNFPRFSERALSGKRKVSGFADRCVTTPPRGPTGSN
jgi:hypothetical protein